MKKIIIISGLLINFLYGNAQWNSKFFTMNDMPDNWRVWSMPARNQEIKTNISNVNKYIDLLFAPETKGKISVNFSVTVYIHKKGKKLNINDYIQNIDIVLDKEEVRYGNLSGISQTGVSKVRFEGKIVDFYSKEWYLQGKSRVYYIKYGSYDKKLYDKYLPIAEKGVKSFKEK